MIIAVLLSTVISQANDKQKKEVLPKRNSAIWIKQPDGYRLQLDKNIPKRSKYDAYFNSREIYSLDMIKQKFKMSKISVEKMIKLKDPNTRGGKVQSKKKTITIITTDHKKKKVNAKLTKMLLRMANGDDLKWYYNDGYSSFGWRGFSTRPYRGCYATVLTIQPEGQQEKLAFIRYYTKYASFFTDAMNVSYDFIYDNKTNYIYIAMLKSNVMGCRSAIEIFKVDPNKTIGDGSLNFISKKMKE